MMKMERTENSYIQRFEDGTVDFVEGFIRGMRKGICSVHFTDGTTYDLNIGYSMFNTASGAQLSEDRQVLFTSNDKDITAYIISTGAILWRLKKPRLGSIFVYSSYLITQNNSSIIKVNIMNGKIIESIVTSELEHIFDLTNGYILADWLKGKLCIIDTKQMTIIKEYRKAITNPRKCLSIVFTDATVEDNVISVTGFEKHADKSYDNQKTEWFTRVIETDYNSLFNNEALEKSTDSATKDGSSKLELPEELEPFRDNIEKSVKPYIKIHGTEGNTLPWESKFGGKPYWPKDMEYPKDYSKKPMRLLAQINFEELPDIGVLPLKGMLQFYLPANDDVYGLDFDDPTSQDSFRVVYIPEVIRDASALKKDFRTVAVPEEGYFPILQEGKLQFSIGYAPVAPEDYQFEKYLGMSPYEFYNQFGELYEETFSGAGHKVGGYAHFTQEDPRKEKYKDYDVLLMQIDTDDELGIMWGDCGVANFFIPQENLKNLDFSRVLYNWDCG